MRHLMALCGQMKIDVQTNACASSHADGATLSSCLPVTLTSAGALCATTCDLLLGNYRDRCDSGTNRTPSDDAPVDAELWRRDTKIEPRSVGGFTSAVICFGVSEMPFAPSPIAKNSACPDANCGSRRDWASIALRSSRALGTDDRADPRLRNRKPLRRLCDQRMSSDLSRGGQIHFRVVACRQRKASGSRELPALMPQSASSVTGSTAAPACRRRPSSQSDRNTGRRMRRVLPH